MFQLRDLQSELHHSGGVRHTHAHPYRAHTSCDGEDDEDNNKRGHRRDFCMNTEMVRNDHTMAFTRGIAPTHAVPTGQAALQWPRFHPSPVPAQPLLPRSRHLFAHCTAFFLCIWTNTHSCIHSHGCVQALRCSRSCCAATRRLRARQVQVRGEKKRLKKDAG